MSVEQFDPKKLDRIDHQNARIDNVDKAEKMAYAQRSLMNLSLSYRDYLKDPEHAQQDEYVDFHELSKAGVTPAFLEDLSNQHAEQAGQAYDYEQALSLKSVEQLKGEIWTNLTIAIKGRWKGMFHQSGLDFVPDSKEANSNLEVGLAIAHLYAAYAETRRRKAAQRPNGKV